MKDLSTLPVGSGLQNGKYKILSVLGQGGFGITYLAEQTGLGMKVAIKEFFMKGSCQRELSTSMVSVPVSDSVELVHRCQRKFKSEARKIASLNNDHIVNIIDVFDENGTSYYVMKYLAGGSMASLVKSGPMLENTALRMIGEVSDALKSVHSSGLLHLDIKPANILLDERGRAVLIDFGVSKYVDSQQDSSTTSSLIGFSRGFAPLEQVNSTITALSPATDIYALGGTLYNLVTGKVPPEASDVMESGLPAMPSVLSDKVKTAIIKAMQPKRTDRPQTIDDFLALLPEEEVQVPSEETVVVNVVPPESEASAGSRKGMILPVISGIMLAAAVILAAVTFLNKPEPVVETRTEVVDNSAEVNALKKKNNEFQDQINSLNSQVKTLKSTNTSLQQENTKLKSEVSSLKPDAERWRRQLQMNK